MKRVVNLRGKTLKENREERVRRELVKDVKVKTAYVIENEGLVAGGLKNWEEIRKIMLNRNKLKQNAEKIVPGR